MPHYDPARMSSPASRFAPRWLRTLAWLGVFVWLGAICFSSSLPGSELQRLAHFMFWDKAQHFLAFAIGSANLALVLRWSTPWPPARVALFTILAVATFGAVDEIHQLFTPGRSGGDAFDWLADAFGAAAGAGSTLFIHARRRPSPHLLAPARD